MWRVLCVCNKASFWCLQLCARERRFLREDSRKGRIGYKVTRGSEGGRVTACHFGLGKQITDSGCVPSFCASPLSGDLSTVVSFPGLLSSNFWSHCFIFPSHFLSVVKRHRC